MCLAVGSVFGPSTASCAAACAVVRPRRPSVRPLDRPFAYTGGSLGIGHFAYESTKATLPYYMDAVATNPTTGSVQRISPNALGCPAGENRAEGFAPNPGGGSVEFFGSGGTPGYTFSVLADGAADDPDGYMASGHIYFPNGATGANADFGAPSIPDQGP